VLCFVDNRTSAQCSHLFHDVTRLCVHFWKTISKTLALYFELSIPVVRDYEEFVLCIGNLVIHNVQRFDAGTYLCKASNGVGREQEKVISVDVLG